MPELWLVFLGAALTALATGLGALPLLAHRHVENYLAIGHAVAAGLMIVASISLLYEGISLSLDKTLLGALLGVALIIISAKLLHAQDDEMAFASLKGVDAKKALLVVGVMTVHSAAEGIGIGVAFGGGEEFGFFVTALLALHNIPEGLAIALIMVPRGASVKRAAMWSIFSSLPQPLIAIPAFLFVLNFAPFLPIGLGLASGAMLWMAFKEMLPEAVNEAGSKHAALCLLLTLAVGFSGLYLVS